MPKTAPARIADLVSRERGRRPHPKLERHGWIDLSTWLGGRIATLYIRFVDIWDAVDRLAKIMAQGA